MSLALQVLILAAIVAVAVNLVLLSATTLVPAFVLVLSTAVTHQIAGSLGAWRIGSLGVRPEDVLFLALCASGVLRLTIRDRPVGAYDWMWMALGCLVFVSFIRGVQIYGSESAAADVRPFFYFVSSAFYVRTHELTRAQAQSLLNLWLLAAGALALIAALRWARDGVHPPGLVPGPEGELIDRRGLNAAGALVVAQGLMMATFMHAAVTKRRTAGLLPVALLVVVLLAQQRTVWVLCLVAVAVVLRRRLGRGRREIATLLGSAVIVGLLAMATLGGSVDRVTGSLDQATDEVNSENSTLVWRVEGWRALLRGAATSGPVDLAVGKPLGSGYERTVQGETVSFTPHNFYVQTFLRLGAAGVVLLVAIYLRRYRGAGRAEEEPAAGLPANLVRVLLLSHLLFFMAYAPDLPQGLLIGLLLAPTASLDRVVEAKDMESAAQAERRLGAP